MSWRCFRLFGISRFFGTSAGLRPLFCSAMLECLVFLCGSAEQNEPKHWLCGVLLCIGVVELCWCKIYTSAHSNKLLCTFMRQKAWKILVFAWSVKSTQTHCKLQCFWRSAAQSCRNLHLFSFCVLFFQLKHLLHAYWPHVLAEPFRHLFFIASHPLRATQPNPSPHAIFRGVGGPFIRNMVNTHTWHYTTLHYITLHYTSP